MHIDIRIARPRRLSFTPLIDVIFLLLLFFMLSSTFSRYSAVEIADSGSSKTAIARPDAILALRKAGLRLNGSHIKIEDLPARLQSLSDSGANIVVVAIAPDVSSQDFVTVLQHVSASPLSVSVARTEQ